MKQEDLQPFKARVLRELQAALDDKSKVVRREAVVARCVVHSIAMQALIGGWILGQSGECRRRARWAIR